MSVYVEVSAVVDRSVEDVFRMHATEHVRNHPRWDPNMQLEQLTDGPLGVGTKGKHMSSGLTVGCLEPYPIISTLAFLIRA